jgi:hypothetical protein
MNAVIRLCQILTVAACSACAHPAYFSPMCPHDELDSHVRSELAIYGPQSGNHEYFAFIYELQGSFGSAVVRGRDCLGLELCVVDPAAAIAQIPKGATLVGEWHTHPHIGAPALSTLDVRGAHHIAHLDCYTPYYSTPLGDIYAWNPHNDSVPTAMNSRVLIGTYGERHARDARTGSRRDG